MFNTPESANAAVERYEALPDESGIEYHKAIDGCAEYFLMRVLLKEPETFKLQEMHDRFDELVSDAFSSKDLALLARRSRIDNAEAGYMMSRNIERRVAPVIAEEYREYLEPLAREAGYIKE